MTATATPGTARSIERWVPLAAALASLGPLVWCWSEFRALFWFGDEWDQLDQIAHSSFWRWVGSCFGENYAPAFKLSWGGLAVLGGGSYLLLVVSVWLMHALCVGLLARWLLRAGVSAVATTLVALVLGVAFTNLETLGWTIQLITVQGMTFFVAAGLWGQSHDTTGRWSPAALAVLLVLVAVATFSFARGTLVGASLGAASLLAPFLAGGPRSRNRLNPAMLAACFGPAIVAAVVVIKFAPGNVAHLGTVGVRAPLEFGAAYFFLNPLRKFLSDTLWTNWEFAAYVAGKTAILLCGWWKATPTQRRLLLPLLLFDLGNAVLMGIGRSDQPVGTATSSRYQYISLVCTLPFVAVVVDAPLRAIASRPRRALAGAILLAAAVTGAGYRWRQDMKWWSKDRGEVARRLLFVDPNPPAEHAIPGIPFLHTDRAKQLTAKYHLH